MLQTICRTPYNKLYCSVTRSHNIINGRWKLDRPTQIPFRKEKAGLFGVEGLHSPSDFERIFKLAKNRANDLHKEVVDLCNQPTSVNSAKQIINHFDAMSEVICYVADTAELCRALHVDQNWINSAIRVIFLILRFPYTSTNDLFTFF